MSENAFQYRPASLSKRLVCIFYDLLLLVALLFTVGLIAAAVITFGINDGNAITADHPAFGLYRLFMLGLLLMTAFVFFGGFWVHGGQTLGMKTWRLKLTRVDGGNIDWKIAALRFIAALLSWSVFGLGFLWSLVDTRRRSWHDLLSASVLIQLEKNK